MNDVLPMQVGKRECKFSNDGACLFVRERQLAKPAVKRFAGDALHHDIGLPREIAGAEAARYRLLGLLTVGATRRALIADGNRRFEIAEGASLGSSTVARIEQDRVVLSSPSGQVEMRLHRPEPDRAEATGPEKRAR